MAGQYEAMLLSAGVRITGPQGRNVPTAPAGVLGTFDIFDAEGRYLRGEAGRHPSPDIPAAERGELRFQA